MHIPQDSALSSGRPYPFSRWSHMWRRKFVISCTPEKRDLLTPPSTCTIYRVLYHSTKCGTAKRESQTRGLLPCVQTSDILHANTSWYRGISPFMAALSLTRAVHTSSLIAGGHGDLRSFLPSSVSGLLKNVYPSVYTSRIVLVE